MLLDGGGEGWGECVADHEPLYSSEHVDGAAEVLRRFLVPRVFAWQREHDGVEPEHVATTLDRVQGHPMAKGALEMAVLDASLRASGHSFGDRLGAVHEPRRLRRVGRDPSQRRRAARHRRRATSTTATAA